MFASAFLCFYVFFDQCPYYMQVFLIFLVFYFVTGLPIMSEEIQSFEHRVWTTLKIVTTQAALEISGLFDFVMLFWAVNGWYLWVFGEYYVYLRDRQLEIEHYGAARHQPSAG
ncbi:unnamed protein product, partial [Mesorhabditis belari]|uniref:Uncharacterized protein n=1 Tax=Mesorhabditis belari TaxID=2138241 RepID=A0AAF3FCQ6_9BILA